MRIIAGKAGRIAIRVPAAVARPTTDFVRQALYSMLGSHVEGAVVLDLFAGSGALGLEALSRGAATCLFVEQHRQAVATIRQNLAKSGLEGGRVVAAEVMRFLRSDHGCYDLILADPPYCKRPGDTDHIRQILESGLLGARLADGGWFVAESSSQQKPHEEAGWSLVDARSYGGSALWLYRKS